MSNARRDNLRRYAFIVASRCGKYYLSGEVKKPSVISKMTAEREP